MKTRKIDDLEIQNETVLTWIQGDCAAGDIRAMLSLYSRLDFRRAESVETATMIVYTGGADVNPSLYGEKNVFSSFSESRDQADIRCWLLARQMKKFQVGICRGSQFLNVMNGGKMWQDVTHHAGRSHLVKDVLSDDYIEVSSFHHQQSVLNSRGKLLAWCEESDKKASEKTLWKKSGVGSSSTDVEAFWYPDSRSLGVQWHPEWGPKPCVDLFFKYIEKFRNEVL